MEPKRVARAVADARILLIGKTVIPTGAPITPERSTAALTVDLDLAGIRMGTAIGVPYPIIKWTVWMQPKRVARAVAEVNRQQQRLRRRLHQRRQTSVQIYAGLMMCNAGAPGRSTTTLNDRTGC